MKVKLKTSAKHRFGQVNNLPHLGETKFDEKGFTEGEFENAEQLDWLLNSIPDLEIVEVDGEKIEQHQVSAEDLNNNPALTDAGVTVGENIGIPVDEQIKPQTESNDLGKAVEGDIGGGNEQKDTLLKSNANSSQETDVLAEVKFDDLKALAGDFPKEEWESLNEEKLRAYLKAKLS